MIRKLSLPIFVTLFLGFAAQADDINRFEDFSPSVQHPLNDSEHCDGCVGFSINTITGDLDTVEFLLMAADKKAKFTAISDKFGTEIFEFKDSVGTLFSITVIVTAVNDEPSFTPGSNLTVAEDVVAQTQPGWATAISAGPANESGQVLTFTVTNNLNGLFSAQPAIDASGELTYTPAADTNGVAIVDVVLSDDGGIADGGDDTYATQQFTITVTAVNDEPSFTPGSNLTVAEDVVAQTQPGWATAISAGPADESGQVLTFTVTNNLNGLFSAQPAIDASGELTYTPAADTNGVATVDVVLSDDGGKADGGDDTYATQQFTITVTAVNDSPTLANAIADVNVSEDASNTVISLTNVFADADISTNSDTLTMTVTGNTNVALFSSVVLSDGSADAIIDDTLTLDYALDQNGTTDITITATDGGALTITDTFTVTVTVVNDAPTLANNVSTSLDEGATVTISSSNISVTDVDDDATQLTVTIASGPTYGDIKLSGISSSSFTQDDINNNLITYVHDGSENFTDSFGFSIADGGENGAAAVTGTFNITISLVNDNTPVVVADAYTVAEGGSLTETAGLAGTGVLGNDSDADLPGDTLTVSVVATATQGGLTLDADGSFSYGHDDTENFTDSFTYTVFDGVNTSATQTVSITITPVNDNAPVGTLDLLSVDEGATVIGNLLSNDSDIDQPGDTLTVIAVNGNPANMDVAVALASGSGSVTVNADGTVTFVASAVTTVEIFSDSFTYSITDGVFTTSDIPVNITLVPVNDNAPTASTIPDVSADEDAGDTTVVLNSYFNDLDIDADGELDSDPGPDYDSLTFTATSSNTTLVTLSTIAADLILDFQDNQHGTSIITVTATDDLGRAVSTDFTLTVNSVNDVPVYQVGSHSDLVVNEDDPPISVALDSAFVDIDLVDGDPSDEQLTFTLTITETPNEFVRTALLDVASQVTSVIDDNTYVIETTNGSVSLPLVADAFGDISIVVRATDLGRPPASPAAALPLFDEASFSITINAIGDDIPVAVDDGTAIAPFITIAEDSDAVDILVIDNDYGGDVPVRVVSVGQTVDIGGVLSFYRTTTRQADLLNTGDSITTVNGEVICADCGAPSADSTIFGDGLVINIVRYKPTAEFNGMDSFDYCIRDSVGSEESCATVYIEVTPVNDPPESLSDVTFMMDQADDLVLDASEGLRTKIVDLDNTHIDGFGCDPLDPLCEPPPTDPPPDTLYFQFVSAVTANGQLLPPFLEDGSFNYRPDATFSGTDSFLFDVCDRPIATATADNCVYGVTANIIVGAISGAPEGSSDDTVEFDYQLSQTPLELPVGPEPNVLIVMDDSGSMGWDILTDQSSGIYYYSTGHSIRYVMKATAGSTTYIAPSEEAAPDNGVWRLRNSTYNTVYYNPAINYQPWKGLDAANNEFPDSPPTAARHNPLIASPVTNLTIAQSYVGRAPFTGTTCGDVCVRWGWSWRVGWYCRVTQYRCTTSSGYQRITSNDYYIPRYYVWDDKNGNGLLDSTPSPDLDPTNSEGTLVEIRATDGGGSPILYPKGTDRSDCSTLADNCTYDEELQNFANWFTYSRNREYTAKWSLGRVVSTAENLRIGYALMNNTSNQRAIASMNTSDRTGAKAALLDSIYATNPSGGTPLRKTLRDAGRMFECRLGDIMGSKSNSSPGDAACPVLAAPEGNCQQNFTLLFTDGAWNGYSPGVGNEDGNDDTAFDGGMYAHWYAQSLADVAMDYYERDLHGLDDEVPTTGRDRSGAASGSFAGGSDDRMHQHMTTYTVGFGVNGLIDDADVPTDYTQSFDWGTPTTTVRKIDDLRHAAVNGRGEYLSASNPSALTDALVSAFEEFAQGSGAASAVSFNSQEVQEDLLIFRAFYNTKINTGDLIAQRLDEDGVIEEPVWRSAARMDLVGFNDREILSFNPDANTGIPFRAASLNTDQQNAFIVDPGGSLTQAEKDAQVLAKVNYLRGDNSNERPTGNFRERPSIEGRLGDIVHSTPVFIGAPSRLNRDAPPYPQSPGLLYSTFKGNNAARTNLIYVSANDGMLHAFNTDTGDEHFAYVPNSLMVSDYGRKVTELLNYEYSHRYFVDLTSAVNDVFIDTDNDGDQEWATVLIGGHGAGSKAYFALDITDPAALTEARAGEVVLWEFTDADDSYPTDATSPWLTQGTPLVNSGGTQRLDLQTAPKPVKDLGYSFSVQTLALSNKVGSSGENEWISIFGNGYNSTSGIAKLFILFIEKGVDGRWCHPDMVYNSSLTPAALPSDCVGEQDFIKLNTTFGVPTSGPRAGFPNGLGTPRGIDVDGNGTIDYAYAGDTLGNFFRFDLSSSDPGDWDVSKIFAAKYVDPVTGAETPQPITTQPIVVQHPTESDGYIVIFATGSYITVSDSSDTQIQSIYGIWDRLGPTLIDKADLIRQKYTNVSDATFGNVRTLSAEVVDYSADGGAMGWYNDLSAVPAGGVEGVSSPEFPGERAIRNIQLRGGLSFVNSVIPRSATSCVSVAGGFALAFCPGTGGTNCLGDNGIFDLNDDGRFDSGDEVDGGSVVAGTRFEDAVPTDASFIGESRITQLSDRSLEIRITNTAIGKNTGRLSWKQLIGE